MRLDDKALQQLFLAARTHRAWLPREVPDSVLKELVDLMKMGPTANNGLPARVTFVRSKAAKERLMPHLSEGNRDKTMKAPACAIIGYDLAFYARPPKGQDPLKAFEGKPEAALSRIVEGRLSGFFKEQVLTEQSSVLDSKKTVGALLTQAGVTVIKSNAYTPGQESFGAQAAAVRAWVSGDGIKAIFIPDAATTAVKVAAAAREAAPQIQLLGTESWNQPDVLAAAGSRIDGAVFADSFFIGSGNASTSDFVNRFRALSGYDPSGYEARAYDAGMLVREAIARGARSRGAVLQDLRAVTDYQGAGTIASGAGGLKPDLVLLQVRDGHVATVSR
jgi:hypothetical protein